MECCGQHEIAGPNPSGGRDGMDGGILHWELQSGVIDGSLIESVSRPHIHRGGGSDHQMTVGKCRLRSEGKISAGFGQRENYNS